MRGPPWFPFLPKISPSPEKESIAGDDGGCIRVDVSTVGPDGARSLVPDASIVLHGNNISMQGTANQQGAYAFASVPPGSYELEARAPGLSGTASVQVKAATTEEVSIQLEIETLKVSVTVDGAGEQLIDSEPGQKASVDKATIENAPTRDDRTTTNSAPGRSAPRFGRRGCGFLRGNATAALDAPCCPS